MENTAIEAYDKFLLSCKDIVTIHKNYPLAELCAFQTGGEAEFFCQPSNEQNLQHLISTAHKHNVPMYLLGGASNVLIPQFVSGLVISTLGCTGISLEDTHVRIKSGMDMRKSIHYLVDHGYSCIEFMYGMPGTIGGALHMNARCYGKEISEVLLSARGYTHTGEPWEYTYDKNDFAYKKSPFQEQNLIIVECTLSLKKENKETLWKSMLEHEFDRRHKGHYAYPCAGSVFKNNREHGKPAGVILDELGFCGKTRNGARVSNRHANIIFNTTRTSACKSSDIYALSEDMKSCAYDTLGITLEREIVLLGDISLWK